MKKLLTLILIAALACRALLAAEPRLRISMAIREVSIQSKDGPLTTGPVIASPIVTLENGRTVEVLAGKISFNVFASIESDTTVRVLAASLKPDDPSYPSELIKLGEKGTVHVGIYAVEMAPALLASGISVEFAGGTLDQLIAKMTDGGKKPFNLLGLKPDMHINLPAFSVRNASPTDFAAALSFLLSAEGVKVAAMASGDNFEPIFVIKTDSNGVNGANHTDFACRDLSEYLKKSSSSPPAKSSSNRHNPYTVDEIVKILGDACQFRNGSTSSDDLRLRFHVETKLLFITGRSESVQTAVNTLDALPKPVSLF